MSTVQYKFTEKSQNVLNVTFKNSVPLKEVTQISYYREENVTGVFTRSQFRYSFDDATWTNFQTLSQTNVNQILFNSQPDFYFEVVYIREGITTGNIQDFYLFYEGCELFPSAPVFDASIDADFLANQPPLYYLDRSNFVGQYINFVAQNASGLGLGTLFSFVNDASTGISLTFRNIDASTGLIAVNNGGTITLALDPSIDASVAVQNIGTGTGDIFAGWGDDTVLNLRTLAGDGLVSITQDASTILMSVDPSALNINFVRVAYSSDLDPSLSMTTAFRDFPIGTTVDSLGGRFLDDIMDDILFPTVNPVTNNPLGSFADNTATLHEINEPITVQYTATFDRGTITIDGNFQNFASGLPNFYNYSDPSSNSLLVDTASTSLTNIQTVNGYVVKIGTQNWISDITYDAGPQPLTNKGDSFGSPLPAGTTSPATVTVEGVYPFFATTITITTMTKQTLVSMLTENNIEYTLVAEQGGNKHKIDIPSSWIGTRPLVGIQQYNTVAQAWEYPGGTPADSLLIWDQSSSSHIIRTVSVNYDRYTYNGSDRSSVQVRLVF